MDKVPTWAWWAAGAVVVLVVVLSRSSTGTTTGGLSVTPVPADPNTEATAQTALTTRAAAFGDLVNGVFGLRGVQSSAQRDVNVSALSAGAAVAQAGIARDMNTVSEYFTTRRTALTEAGATTRTGIEQAGLTTRSGYETNASIVNTAATQAGDTSRTRINADTNLSIASITADLGKYLGDVSFKTSADTNRTAVSINATNAAVQRKQSTDSLLGSLGRSLSGALAALFL